MIFLFLFTPKLTPALVNMLQTPPKSPVSYSFEWSFKSPWDQREDILNQKYLELLESTNGSQLLHSDSNDSAKEQAVSEHSFNVEEEYKNLAMYAGIIAEVSDLKLHELVKQTPLSLFQDFQNIFVNYYLSHLINL